MSIMKHGGHSIDFYPGGIVKLAIFSRRSA
jgi:hypothetical protein